MLLFALWQVCHLCGSVCERLSWQRGRGLVCQLFCLDFIALLFKDVVFVGVRLAFSEGQVSQEQMVVGKQ